MTPDHPEPSSGRAPAPEAEVRAALLRLLRLLAIEIVLRLAAPGDPTSRPPSIDEN